MAIVEVTIVPIGTGSPGVSEYVADVHRILEQAAEPVSYQMTPMSTIIEGDLDDILAVIRRMHERPFEKGALRVSTSIKIDERRDKAASMKQKLESVNEKLGG
ncbi:MTH1187 family thiamine-binding protein [Aneurinibacillus tyrosinisolvens]|uniref:MTH1187 family thiamine-binding protein n=1 Tax=Aneurinibacillus tyrosinisolvens TaxID=1443435 RepID=UPI00063EFEE2|nr:MTH1187 family thiamine-binding protein [Aneurinibacillus tyrosinisolvens]